MAALESIPPLDTTEKLVAFYHQCKANADKRCPVPDGHAPKVAPSLLVKSYALALKSFLTVEPDLADSSEAVFVATPNNRGIMFDVAEPYFNEQLYHHANSIQAGKSLFFQSNEGDYFQYLNDYMLHVQEEGAAGREGLTEEQLAYYSAQEITEMTYRKMLKHYQEIKVQDPTLRWQKFIKSSPDAESYRKLWYMRDELAKKLPASGISLVLKMFDSSTARAEKKPSQNMPCTMLDIRVDDPKRKDNPKDVVFRPAYGLPGYKAVAKSWVDRGIDAKEVSQTIPLDLKTASRTPWSALGFPEFDKLSPVVSESRLDSLKDFTVSLIHKGIAPFRVTRGLWNVEDFRDYTKLRADTRQYLEDEVFRTNVLLFAYGFQVRVKAPTGVSLESNAFSGIFSGLGLSKGGDDVWASAAPRNDGYPVLIAALARRV